MSQRAGYILEKGTPIVIKDRPIPAPSDTDVLVKLLAVGVNPINIAQRDFGAYITEYPALIGLDGVGYIEKVGKDVTRLSVGDVILFQANPFGGPDLATFQEYTIVDQNIAAKVPSNITAVEAATLPSTLTTSAVALFDESGANIKPPFDGPTVAPGSSIVIIGGSGGVGQAAIQLARIAGFDTIIVTASHSHTAFLTSLGATHVLDRSTSAESILEIAPNVQIVYDTISNKDTQSLPFNILVKQGGVIIRTHRPEGIPPRNIKEKYILGPSYHSYLGIPLWKVVEKWLQTGAIKPNRTVVFDRLDRLDDAISKLKEGVSGAKVVVRIY